MAKTVIGPAALAMLLAVAACGDPYDPGQRAGGGAAIVAAAGTTTGAVIGAASTPVPPPPTR